jgi:hypothetical protein
LSAACVQTLDLKKARHEVSQACEPDKQKFCADVVSGKSGKYPIIQCLAQNQSKLSEACQKEIAEMDELKKSHLPPPSGTVQ